MYHRRDIFLHFLNRDSREIYGLFQGYKHAKHRMALRSAINAAVLLCGSRCVIPPGFAVECDIAQSILEEQHLYLRERLIVLPMRETSLADFAEKKRREYAPMRQRYAGLFDDRRLEFLARNAEGLIARRSKVGEALVDGWAAGPDSKARIWRPIKQIILPNDIELIRVIPKQLHDSGTAETWSAIKELLPSGAQGSARQLRRALQNIYFKLYMREFNLVVLRNLPLMLDDFELSSTDKICDYNKFSALLNSIQIKNFILNSPAFNIVRLKRAAGVIRLLNEYGQRAGAGATEADIAYISARAASDTGFEWGKFIRKVSQSPTNIKTLTDDELNELGDALSD